MLSLEIQGCNLLLHDYSEPAPSLVGVRAAVAEEMLLKQALAPFTIVPPSGCWCKTGLNFCLQGQAFKVCEFVRRGG